MATKHQQLAKRLIELRKETGLSGREAARKIGLDHSQILRLERGDIAKPTQELLSRIADGYGIDAEELWALAGYHLSSRTLGYTPYLRSNYDLPPEAVEELRQHFDYVRAKYKRGDLNTN